MCCVPMCVCKRVCVRILLYVDAVHSALSESTWKMGGQRWRLHPAGTPTAVDLPTTTTPRCRRRTLFNTKMIIIISRHIPGGSRVLSVTGCYRPAGRSQNNVLPPTSGVHPRKVVFFSNIQYTYMYMRLFYTGWFTKHI